jgi:hypothetical protein
MFFSLFKDIKVSYLSNSFIVLLALMTLWHAATEKNALEMRIAAVYEITQTLKENFPAC